MAERGTGQRRSFLGKSWTQCVPLAEIERAVSLQRPLHVGRVRAQSCLTSQPDVAHQAPLPVELYSENTGVGGHFLLQGNLPHPGIESESSASPALTSGFFTTVPPGRPYMLHSYKNS